MRCITKASEPKSFTNWKNTPPPGCACSFEDLQNPQKKDLHEALIGEQGRICCYCEQRITPDKSHIEHLKPRRTFTRFELDYDNMLASCNGRISPGSEAGAKHCGHRKGNWFDPALMVSPLEPDCELFFKYDSNGEIYPATDPVKRGKAEKTISKLGLSDDGLIAARRGAIKGATERMDALTSEEIARMIADYGVVKGGEFPPFPSVIVCILQLYL